MVDESREKLDAQRMADAFYCYTFGVGASFQFISQGHDPPAEPSVYIPVILIGFVIRGIELLLLTNPIPRGIYQTKEHLDWAGTRGINPDGTLGPGGAPVLFDHDRTDHIVNRREKWKRQ